MIGRADKISIWTLFLLVLVSEFAVGYYISHVIGFVHSDAMSRVANAFYVLYSRDPHLAAIGFIWNPLPSLVEILFLLPYKLYHQLASSALAGVLMSSMFAAMTAVLLVKLVLRYGQPLWFALLFSVSFSFNPFFFLFGFNGLSDAPFFFFIMLAVSELSLWVREREMGNLVRVSFALALAFWVRYEAVPLGASIALSVMIVVLCIRPEKDELASDLKYKLHKIEGTWSMLMAPIVYSGLLWILLNYLIMGNPFYFLNSEYSNVAQAQSLAEEEKFARMIGNPLQTLKFIVNKTAYFSIPLAGIVLIRLWNRRWELWDGIVLLLLFSSILALQFLLLLKGTSYGWLRYFMYVFPITVAWLPYELSRVRRSWVNYGIVLVSLWASAVLLTFTWMNPELAPDENRYLHAKQHAASMTLEREIADYLETELGQSEILMDSYSAYSVILNSKRPSRYLITSDYNFKKALANPVDEGIDYILTLKPDKSSALSAENSMYPDFYEKGASWCVLHKEFGGKWRIYRVIRAQGEMDIAKGES